jgi:hypothetical protein
MQRARRLQEAAKIKRRRNGAKIVLRVTSNLRPMIAALPIVAIRTDRPEWVSGCLSLPRLARQRRAGTYDVRRRNSGVTGEGEQEPVVVAHVLQYRGKKPRLARGGAERVGSEAGQRKESRQPLRFTRQICKRLNRKVFRRFAADSINFGHRSIFSIP